MSTNPSSRAGGFNPKTLNRRPEQKEYENQIMTQHHIERPKPSQGNLFDKPIQPKNRQPQEEGAKKLRDEKNGPKQEERSMEVQKPVYTVEELIRSAPPENSSPVLPRTRGYTLLKNYLKEMRDSGMVNNFNSRNYQIMKNLQSNNATLLEADKNSFVPTILRKNVDEWDENSELAFEMNTKTILNRLTPQNIDASIHELLPKINSDPQRLEFMIETLIHKATTEKSFSHVYADFVKHLTYLEGEKELAARIISSADESYNNLVLNASSDNSDNESEIYIGCATFIGNLVKNGTLTKGQTILSQLIERLPVEEDTPLNTHIIEMLFNFIKSVGDDFIQQNKKQLEKIDEVLKNRKNIKSFHRFMLIDTHEIINSAINNSNYDDNLNGQENGNQDIKNLDELKSICRNGFASYQGDYSAVPECVSKMNSMDFLEGTMLLFLDMKDIYDFTYYQCFVLKSLHFQASEIVKMLIKYVKIFTEQKIVHDCPLIWQNFSQILCQMIIHSVLKINDAILVHSEIIKLNSSDGKDSYDPISDLLYFIDDNFDFSEAIEFDSPDYPTHDINFALKLPETINNTDLQVPSFSRIITVGIIRSIFYKFSNENEDQSVNGLQKWKKLLSMVNQKRPKLFHDIVGDELINYGTDFQIEDVIRFISQ